ncbi:hypothetical protein [Chryseosolibacter indicus]|uniref:Uncharacterized protein n=1 Tax=Chryseosolibacter indicus TaxID=2782351 RepID=A0ABS5VVY1_9BACT|nr:hypothetical protein [Chryseosolibacter indicus]MBT1705598.1 hypothetical protein [Chryseosolibacter indicus]
MEGQLLIYKNRRLIKWLIIAIAALVCFASGRHTFSLFQRYITLSNNDGLAEQLNVTASKYPSEAFNGGRRSDVIFDAISTAARNNQVTIKKINSPVLFEESTYELLTEEVVLEGDFVKIISCINEAESKMDFIKIASMKFEREQQSAKSETLLLKIYFQWIKEQENE